MVLSSKVDDNMTSNNTSVSVVVTTYNKPQYLRLTLNQLKRQSHKPDQIIVADDGSGSDTTDVIREFTQLTDNTVHVWHEDTRFRKCEIANKAITAATSDYLIFMDDDCFAAPWFVGAHLAVAKQGAFTVGASVNLNETFTKRLLAGEGSISDFLALKMLDKMRLIETSTRVQWFKLYLRTLLTGTSTGRFMDRIYLGRGVFRGGNSGGWRSDFVAVNGFNNDMVYGHEDREIGERLRNLGLQCRQVRYAAANFHLDHDRPYADSEVKAKQRQIYRYARKAGITGCKNGLRQV